MKHLVYIGSMIVLMTVLTVPAIAEIGPVEGEVVVTTPSRDVADQLEPAPSYGYMYEDGSVAVALDTAAVFVPDLLTMIVHPDHENEAMQEYNADDLGEGRWGVPDPLTGRSIEVEVQYAAYSYDDGSAAAQQILDGGLATLATVPADSVALVRWSNFPVYRLLRHHICGDPIDPPWPWWAEGDCWYGYQYHKMSDREYLECRFQPYNYCMDWLQPIWELRKYYCRDCSGHVVWQQLYSSYVCAAL